MLISALLSSIDEDHYLRLLVNNNDLKLLLGHFVNFLLNIGIIRPLEEGTNSDILMVIIKLLKSDQDYSFSHAIPFVCWQDGSVV